MKRSRARIRGGAAGLRNLEEAVAFNSEVERTARRSHAARAEIARRADRTRAEAHLESNRRLAGGRGRRPGNLDLLIDEILELHVGLLEPHGVDVGEVVRHVVDVRLLGVHPARRRIQCSNHVLVTPK